MFLNHNKRICARLSMYKLENKVVLITGAANGIGAAIVTELVREQVKRIVILDIDEDTGVALQNGLNKTHIDKIKFIKCDVTDRAQLFEAFRDTVEKNGQIDVVINNAAIINERSYDVISKQIEINLTAVVNGTLKAIELMRVDKGGRGGTIINISSIAALIKHSPLQFVYTATKSAVMQFSNCIGREPYCLTTGVRVITICFGMTDTNMIQTIQNFDEGIDIENILQLYPKQTRECAALGTIEAFKNGKSGSTWLINNGKPAQDITITVEKAFADMSQLLVD